MGLKQGDLSPSMSNQSLAPLVNQEEQKKPGRRDCSTFSNEVRVRRMKQSKAHPLNGNAADLVKSKKGNFLRVNTLSLVYNFEAN